MAALFYSAVTGRRPEKKMKCEDLQLNLAVYFDDTLSEGELAILDKHLDQCPLCRQSFDDFHKVRNGLRSLARPEPAADLIASIRYAVSSKLEPAVSAPAFKLLERRRNWLDVWMMPYAVGVSASLILSFSLLWLILSASDAPFRFEAASARESSSDRAILLANASPSGSSLGIDLTPLEYANSRSAFAFESPSVNPRGALVALTRSLVRGEMRDDEVVVVADVFGNGLAKIAEVVEPSNDQQAIIELQKALQSDPAFAPFVPANLDHRSETIRVVLRIQSVNVSTGPDAPSY